MDDISKFPRLPGDGAQDDADFDDSHRPAETMLDCSIPETLIHGKLPFY